MNVRIEKSLLAGAVEAPPSKSIAHRLIICAALSDGESRIGRVDLSDDVRASIRCVNALGAKTEFADGTLRVRGTCPSGPRGGALLDCGECGSTLRFLLPVCLTADTSCTLTGSRKLLSRPMDVYKALCEEKGLTYEQTQTQIRVRGPLKGGVYTLPGNVSSQFVSGLMFALPRMEADSEVRITSSTESRPYIDLTSQALDRFGVKVCWKDGNTLLIPGKQRYIAADAENEGDWSNAAVFYALRSLGHRIEITGVKEDSLQGDRICLKYLQALEKPGAVVDLTDCPDLGPILFAYAAARHGGRFTGTRRLRIKESDRVQAMARELIKFGCALGIYENEVTVPDVPLITPQTPLYAHNDHRVVMSLALLCLRTGGLINGAEAVNKSYPAFFDELTRLGGKITNEA